MQSLRSFFQSRASVSTTSTSSTEMPFSPEEQTKGPPDSRNLSIASKRIVRQRVSKPLPLITQTPAAASSTIKDTDPISPEEGELVEAWVDRLSAQEKILDAANRQIRDRFSDKELINMVLEALSEALKKMHGSKQFLFVCQLPLKGTPGGTKQMGVMVVNKPGENVKLGFMCSPYTAEIDCGEKSIPKVIEKLSVKRNLQPPERSRTGSEEG